MVRLSVHFLAVVSAALTASALVIPREPSAGMEVRARDLNPLTGKIGVVGDLFDINDTIVGPGLGATFPPKGSTKPKKTKSSKTGSKKGGSRKGGNKRAVEIEARARGRGPINDTPTHHPEPIGPTIPVDEDGNFLGTGKNPKGPTKGTNVKKPKAGKKGGAKKAAGKVGLEARAKGRKSGDRTDGLSPFLGVGPHIPVDADGNFLGIGTLPPPPPRGTGKNPKGATKPGKKGGAKKGADKRAVGLEARFPPGIIIDDSNLGAGLPPVPTPTAATVKQPKPTKASSKGSKKGGKKGGKKSGGKGGAKKQAA